jgi:hypothetical protein
VIYLAVPYSHPDPDVMEKRYLAANKTAYRLMVYGHAVFSPISQSHPIEQTVGVRKNWDFWRYQDLTILDRCDTLFILCLDGWKESVGVTEEIEYARANDIDIIYLRPEDFEV